MSGMASLTALLLWFGTTPVPPVATGLSASISGGTTTVSVGDNNGGAVISFAHRVLELNDSQAQVRVEGSCSSACALITALPRERVCVGQSGRILIHQASFPGGMKDSRLTQLMWDVYPDWIQDLIGKPAELGPIFVEVSHLNLVGYYGPCIE